MKHLYIAKLLKKDNLDELHSIRVEGKDKYDAIAQANRLYKDLYPKYFTYAYVVVTLEKENTRID